jgi:LCP family protein required for cell wall assembly
MNDWPEGWTRDGAGSGEPDEETRVVPLRPQRPVRESDGATARIPLREPVRDAVRGRRTWEQESRRTTPPPPPPPSARPSSGGAGSGGRGRGLGLSRINSGGLLRRVVIVLLLVVALMLGLVFYCFSRVEHVDALHDYAGRPDATPGQDWLLVGSDSREGLSKKQVRKLHVGRVAGRRTDTIILLHIASSGPSTLVSLPRDSYVPIPGHGRNKLNAAYAFGGAPLLAQTVEQVTGIRLDHYAEIGFGGFVGMTDAVGGVELCPKRRIRDSKSGLNVRKGCQEMDGTTALAYVRARYFDPRGDLGRVQRQQEFLGAIFHQATKPTSIINPFRIVALGNAGTKSLTVDDDDGPIDLMRFGLAMRAIAGGKGTKTTVPIADPDFRTSAGSAVRWDRQQALALFRSLR